MNVVVTLVVTGVAFAAWVASRRRIAADTIGRAEEQARRLATDAARDADTRRKEVLVDAKERAHDISSLPMTIAGSAPQPRKPNARRSLNEVATFCP